MPTIDPKRLAKWKAVAAKTGGTNEDADGKRYWDWGRASELDIHALAEAAVYLLAEREELLTLLRSLECGTESMCPCCRATVSRGGHENDTFGEHKPDCRLAWFTHCGYQAHGI